MPEGAPSLAALLQDALALPPEERPAFLAAVLERDPVLAARLERLLELDDATGLALDQPVEAVAAGLFAGSGEEDEAPSAEPGTRLGAWRLLRELGRGGMGSVWLAERADGEFEQHAALKLIKLGMDSAHVVRQFRQERELLARLRHPNIAALLDGGLDARGRPWFAMEYVEGVPLGRWLEQTRPDLRTRLQLFAQLCDAVGHAHQHLIVHRDLKPGNVLVEADGTPRLLDFGIARLTAEEDPTQTATVHRFLSRDFAAPEQLRGEPVSTAADVYALGLILFEILTDRRYRRLHAGATDEVTLRPSAAPLETAAGTADGIPRQTLRGDIDAIVAHALAADPARRYATAQQLGEDVRRHLAGRPIEARPDSALYRVGKFVRRNRAAVAVAVIGLLAVLVAAGVALRQAAAKTQEAERARVALRQAEATRDFALSMFAEADPTTNRGADASVGELLARGEERVLRELADEPEVAAQLLDQIGQTWVSLDQDEPARTALAQALAMNARARAPALGIRLSAGSRLAWFRHVDGDPEAALGDLDRLLAEVDAAEGNPAIIAQVAKIHELRESILYATDRKDEAVAAGEAALARWARIRSHYPLDTLWSMIGQSDLLAGLGRGEEALRLADDVLADPALEDAEAPPALRANAHGVRVRALQALGRNADAEPMLRETVAEFGKVYGPAASMTRYWRYRHAQTLQALGRLDEAQEAVDAILALPPEAQAIRNLYPQLLAARIAAERGAADAPQRIGEIIAAACGETGKEDLCGEAQALGAPTTP